MADELFKYEDLTHIKRTFKKDNFQMKNRIVQRYYGLLIFQNDSR